MGSSPLLLKVYLLFFFFSNHSKFYHLRTNRTLKMSSKLDEIHLIHHRQPPRWKKKKYVEILKTKRQQGVERCDFSIPPRKKPRRRWSYCYLTKPDLAVQCVGVVAWCCFDKQSGNFATLVSLSRLHSSVLPLSLSLIPEKKLVFSSPSLELVWCCQQTKLQSEVWTLLHSVPVASHKTQQTYTYISTYGSALAHAQNWWADAADTPRTLWVVCVFFLQTVDTLN